MVILRSIWIRFWFDYLALEGGRRRWWVSRVDLIQTTRWVDANYDLLALDLRGVLAALVQPSVGVGGILIASDGAHERISHGVGRCDTVRGLQTTRLIRDHRNRIFFCDFA